MKTSERSDWSRRARRFTLAASVALVMAVFMVGCGSSSTSSNGGGSGGGGSGGGSGELDARTVAVQVTSLATDFEDYAELFRDLAEGDFDSSELLPLSIEAEAPNNSLANITRNILRLTLGTGEVGIQETDEATCTNDGSYDKTLTENGYILKYENCRFTYIDPGYFLVNGTFVYDNNVDESTSTSVATFTYTDVSVAIVVSEGTSLTLEADGIMTSEVIDLLSGAGKITLDISFDYAIECGGDAAAIGFVYDDFVFEFVNTADNGVDAETTLDGTITFSLTDADGTTSSTVFFETTTPLKFVYLESIDEDVPYVGTIIGTLDGAPFEVEYVEAGLFIDGDFISWEQLEADLEEDETAFDGVFECFFSAFLGAVDFDFDFDFDDLD